MAEFLILAFQVRRACFSLLNAELGSINLLKYNNFIKFQHPKYANLEVASKFVLDLDANCALLSVDLLHLAKCSQRLISAV